MFRCGNGQIESSAMRFVIDQLFVVAFEDEFLHLLVSLYSPVEGITNLVEFVPGYPTQIVDQIATTNYQNVFFSQGCQLLCQVIMGLRSLVIVQTHLDDRNICLRVKVFHHAPATVIQPPFQIKADFCFG